MGGKHRRNHLYRAQNDVPTNQRALRNAQNRVEGPDASRVSVGGDTMHHHDGMRHFNAQPPRLSRRIQTGTPLSLDGARAS